MKEAILELFHKENYKPLSASQIAEALNTNDFVNVVKSLTSLEEEHIIIHNDFGLFALLKTYNMYIGTIDVKEQGFGFVTIEGFEKDLFIKKDYCLNAMSGDTVIVQILNKNKISFDAKVIEIINRKYKTLIGKIKKRHKDYELELEHYDLNVKCLIQPKNINNAVEGDYVKCIITDYNNGHLIKAKVDKIIGNDKTPNLDINLMVQIKDIPTSFSSRALNEANMLDYTISINNRKDLRDKIICTIDGDDAKDFDDAISIEKINDNYILGVHIADVSEYVKVDSYLDQDAKARSFSCYLPNGVIPMLPFSLSDDLCSLRENEDRYTISLEMTIDRKGNIIDYELNKAVIKSKARLTYNLVNEWLDERPDLEELNVIYLMEELYYILNKKRVDKGIIDFDLDEAKVTLDDLGKCIDVKLIKRGISERIIEEFMITANECIAEIVHNLDLPFIYRVHAEPSEEKIEELRMLLANLNIKLPKKNNNLTSKFFADIIKKEEEKNPDNKEIINHLILKSMAKAKYDTYNIGHFGLASLAYTHFTSPIRRYPDLVVHRLIKDYLLKDNNYGKIDNIEKELSNISNLASTNERKIEMLERDVLDMKKAEYMEQFIGSIFIGSISSIKSWGIYVTLDNTVEGLIDAYNLNLNDYFYDEDKNIWKSDKDILSLTKKIKIRVQSVNIDKGQIDFMYQGGEK